MKHNFALVMDGDIVDKAESVKELLDRANDVCQYTGFTTLSIINLHKIKKEAGWAV